VVKAAIDEDFVVVEKGNAFYHIGSKKFSDSMWLKSRWQNTARSENRAIAKATLSVIYVAASDVQLPIPQFFDGRTQLQPRSGQKWHWVTMMVTDTMSHNVRVFLS
jgi:hypothetical protein